MEVIRRNDDYGQWGSQAFERLYKEDGGTVYDSFSYEPAHKHFDTHVARIQSSRPDAVYLVGYSEIGAIARQARERGLSPRYPSITSARDPEALQLAERALEATHFTEAVFYTGNPDPALHTYYHNYRARFNEEPEAWGATFCEPVHIAAAAWKGRNYHAASLRESLLRLKAYRGITGPTPSPSNGDVRQQVAIRQLRKGTPQLNSSSE